MSMADYFYEQIKPKLPESATNAQEGMMRLKTLLHTARNYNAVLTGTVKEGHIDVIRELVNTDVDEAGIVMFKDQSMLIVSAEDKDKETHLRFHTVEVSPEANPIEHMGVILQVMRATGFEKEAGQLAGRLAKEAGAFLATRH